MKKIFILLIILTTKFVSAQNPGDVAQNFGPEPGLNGHVQTMILQPDGKILVGGEFTSYGKIDGQNKIIRLNTDGTKDISFNSGTGFNVSNSIVNTIALQSDGKILIGGFFSTYKGVTENKIIRLNSDGTKDTSFNTGTGFNDEVKSIAIQTDGKIIVGGTFTTYKGVTEKKIIRLNIDGTKDTSFNTGTGINSGGVTTIVIQTDGKIIVGGGFLDYKGVSEGKILRLNADGTKDISFNTGTGFDDLVNTITTQADGKILIGGYFSSYKGMAENRIIRLNSDGTKDTSFYIGTGFEYAVNTITTQTDGKIIVGGRFTYYQDISEKHIIRLNTNGTKDTSFNTETGYDNDVCTIVIQTNGKIIVGGMFLMFKEVPGKTINRLNSDGTKDTLFNTGDGFNSSVATIATQSDGKILVGGQFSSYNLILGDNRIIRLNSDGTKDMSFNSGTGFNNFVTKIVPLSDGKIIVGGAFSTYNGVTSNNIVRLNSDGTIDNYFSTGTGFNYGFTQMAVQPDGKIIVSGSFTTYNGVTENRIIRLNSDGTKDVSFNTGTGLNGPGYAITIQPDGKIIVGGSFSIYNGVTSNNIVRLNSDGTKDTSFNIGVGFGGSVHAITLQPDGKIFVGGDFSSYKGINEYRIIRLNSDGTKDISFVTGIGFFSGGSGVVTIITKQTDGKILVGGSFSDYQGITAGNIIRLNIDGTKDTSFNTGTGFGIYINTIVIHPNGKILVGGPFWAYNGNLESAYLIALHPETVLTTENFTNHNGFKLFPNPVKNILNIELEKLSNQLSIKIYDLYGKLIQECQEKTIDVGNFSPGLYLINVKTDEGEFTKKFIKE